MTANPIRPYGIVRRCPPLLLAFALACICGCQSGQIAGVQTSTDGEVIAFRDQNYDRLYVADSKGVRSIGKFGCHVLSPDGCWLALFVPRDEGMKDYPAGTPVFLIDLNNNHRYSTVLPARVPNVEDVKSLGKSTACLGAESGIDPPPKIDPPCLFFGPGPQLTIGPIQSEYWIWRAQDSRGTVWTRMSSVDATRAIPPPLPALPVFSYIRDYCRRRPDTIVEIPCDGRTAPRTVWVRPDGRVLELVRKNDAPGWCACAVVTPIALPAALVGDVVIGVATLQFPGYLSGMTLYSDLIAWGLAFEGLEVDKAEVEHAQTELRRQIEQRRAAPASQPATAPAEPAGSSVPPATAIDDSK